MDDRTGDDLIALAPEVDMPAARAAFARRRAQARRRRRIGSAALATTLVLAGIGAWAAIPEDDGVTVDSGLLDGVSTAPAPEAERRGDPTDEDVPITQPDIDGETPGETEPPLSDPTAAEDPSVANPNFPDAAPAVAADGGCVRPPGSSPGAFDGTHHLYAAHIVGYDSGSLAFDVVQWLSGEDAAEAYRRDNPDAGTDDGPPNDYYIVNADDQVRTLPVAAGIQVGLLWRSEGVEVSTAELSELADHLAEGNPSDVYWLTFAGEDGPTVVTGICQQYRP